MKTTIEWVGKNGRTWNFGQGCELASPGCFNCYAMKLAYRFSGEGKPFHGLVRLRPHGKGPVWTGAKRAAPDHLFYEPLHVREATTWFPNSMSDTFYQDEETIVRAFAVMVATPRHSYLLLTKRSDVARRFMDTADVARIYAMAKDLLLSTPAGKRGATIASRMSKEAWTAECDRLARCAWPPENIAIGASAENQEWANVRLPELVATNAAMRFVSFEPNLGPIVMRPEWLGWGRAVIGIDPRTDSMPGIHWGIGGGESGPGARVSDLDNLRRLQAQFEAAGVPWFAKQTGAKFIDSAMDGADAKPRRPAFSAKGGDLRDFPEAMRVQDFPQWRRRLPVVAG